MSAVEAEKTDAEVLVTVGWFKHIVGLVLGTIFGLLGKQNSDG